MTSVLYGDVYAVFKFLSKHATAIDASFLSLIVANGELISLEVALECQQSYVHHTVLCTERMLIVITTMLFFRITEPLVLCSS